MKISMLARKYPANRRKRRIKLVAAAVLAAAGVAATAGCASQTGSASASAADVSVEAPSAAPSTTQQPPVARNTAATATAAGSVQGTQTAPTSADPEATKSRSVAVAVEDCGQGAALPRPGQLVLACADQGLWAKSLTWSSWSATSATATGVITWRVCTPNCAESTKWDTASAQVTLTDPVSEPGDQILFTKLEMHVTGSTPTGFTRDATFDMAPN